MLKNFSNIISHRDPSMFNNWEGLGDYYRRIISPLVVPSTDKNKQMLDFVFSEAENFFLIINNCRFIVKCNGMYYPDVEDFEAYMFNNFYKYTLSRMSATLTPIMITDEDREFIRSERQKHMKNVDDLINYDNTMNIYFKIDDYYKLNIIIDNVSGLDHLLTH